MNIKIIATLMLSVSLLLGGCLTSTSGDVYSRDQTRKTQDVEYGTVVSVREITIEGSSSGAGAVAGGAIGGIGGSATGKGKGKTIMTILGALGGALLGGFVEEKGTRKEGLEITVKLKSGKNIVIAQATEVAFRKGDPVQVVTGGGVTRVSPR